MANIKRNFYLAILIENLYSFYNTATVIFGVVFFYSIFDNVLLATLPLVVSHLVYALLVKPFATYAGKIGTRKSLTISMLFFGLTPIPVIAYYQQQEAWYLILWFILYYVAKLFFHSPLLFIFGQVTDHNTRGKQVSFKRVSITLTQVVTPLVTGLILSSFGFAEVVLFATIVILLSIAPIWLLPNIFYHVSTSVNEMASDINIRKLWMLNTITELHISGSHQIWVIYLFVVLAESYLNLGILISFTTLSSIILLLVFGRILDSYNRINSFRITTLLVVLANIMRAIPLIPVVITDTYNRVVKGIQMEAVEVINFDLMNDGLKLQNRDELVIAREIGINIAISISYLFASLLAFIFGFQLAFIAIGVIMLILTRRFK